MKLSSIFSKKLKEHGMDGYLAEARPEYELLIRDKIKNEIKSSDYLVGIMTETALISASVHEEIGFAIGTDIPVLLMVEEGLKEKGVLIYGKEPEYFTENFFEPSCENIIKFLKSKGERKKESLAPSVPSSTEFLASRNLLDSESETFALNEQFEILRDNIPEEHIPNGKPYVLFSCCPKTIRERVDVNSKDFAEWIDKHQSIEIKNHHIRFLEGRKKIDMDSVIYQDDPRGDGKIVTYLEFHNSGFFEQCFVRDMIYDARSTNNPTKALLHLCALTGSFWAFLKFCQLYYEKIGIDEPFVVMMSIKNTKDLMLMGFGGKPSEGQNYVDPVDGFWSSPDPRTKKKNIQLRIELPSTTAMTDDFIEDKVKKISKKISNAYGLPEARCFSYDGSFAWNLMSHFRR